MNLAKMQADVTDFHRAAGVQIGNLQRPELPDEGTKALRIRLIEEEFREFREALQDGDLIEAADAIADLLYVTVGAGVAMGLDLEMIWDEVQRSNMAKFPNGIARRRGDGKILKPDGWTPPNIAGVIREQMLRHSVEGRFDFSDSAEDEPTIPRRVTTVQIKVPDGVDPDDFIKRVVSIMDHDPNHEDW
jgi:predicted HAD superfamily Cof-like phosphohydrolase